jgi:hypothetical protein
MYANTPIPISAEIILIPQRLAVLWRRKTHGADGLEQQGPLGMERVPMATQNGIIWR